MDSSSIYCFGDDFDIYAYLSGGVRVALGTSLICEVFYGGDAFCTINGVGSAPQ